MSQKSKSQKSKASIEDLLKEAGFQTLEKRGERVLIASGAEDFGKSHAAFLKASCKHPAYVGCSEFPTFGKRTLLVHVRAVENVEAVQDVEDEAGETPAVPEEPATEERSD